MTGDLTELETLVDGLLANIAPSSRRAVALEIATELRRSNASRIRDNVGPDGMPFAGRKSKLRDKQGRIQKKQAMFQKLQQQKHLKRQASGDGLRVGFFKATSARIARVHHEGGTDRVTRSSGSIKAKYAKRELLGLPAGDETKIMNLLETRLNQNFEDL